MTRPLDPQSMGRSRPGSDADYVASVERLRRDTVRRVRDDMQGMPAATVHRVLVERLRGRLPGVDVDEEQMRRVAWAIEHGRTLG